MCQFLRKKGIDLPQDAAVPLWGIYPKDDSFYHRETCLVTFIAALFVIVRNWKQPRCLLTDDGIKKMWYLYTIKYYTVVENEIHGLINGIRKKSP